MRGRYLTGAAEGVRISQDVNELYVALVHDGLCEGILNGGFSVIGIGLAMVGWGFLFMAAWRVPLMIQWGKYDDARAAYNLEMNDRAGEPQGDDEPEIETIIEDEDEDGGNGGAMMKPLGSSADRQREEVVKVSEIPLLMLDNFGRNTEEE
eukprot:gene12200-14410_t